LSAPFTKEKLFEIQDLCYVAADRFAAVGRSGALSIFDAKSGKAKHKLRDAPEHSYASIAVAPNGSHLACVDDGKLFIWDLATNRLICEMQVNETSSYSVGFSPDTKLIAVAINQVFVWKLDDIIAKPSEQKATKSPATTKRNAKVKR
jgi:WD40 repeat protein